MSHLEKEQQTFPPLRPRFFDQTMIGSFMFLSDSI